jgi:predicted DNA-binding transcriptional regulator AlpA
MKRIGANALVDFDELPDSAFVRMPVMTALFAVSKASIWRWTRDGRLPSPTRISGVTLWNVGELRIAMRAARAPLEQGEGAAEDRLAPLSDRSGPTLGWL